MKKMVEKNLEKWGRIEVMVKREGNGKREKIIEIKEEEWNKGMEKYLINEVRKERIVVNEMKKKKQGVIINIQKEWDLEKSEMLKKQDVLSEGIE